MIYQSRSLRSLLDARLRRLPIDRGASHVWRDAIWSGALVGAALVLTVLL